MGLPVESMNSFLVSKKNELIFYDLDTFKVKQEIIKIELFESTTREENEILSLRISKHEDKMAVLAGKNLNMNETKP